MKRISLVVALCVSLVTLTVGKAAADSKSGKVTFLSEGIALNVQIEIQSAGPLLQPFGALPVLGRDFIKQDFEKSSPAVAIISSSVWVAAGSKPNIIGQKIKAGDREFLIVAVAPKTPAPLEGMKVWLAGTR